MSGRILITVVCLALGAALGAVVIFNTGRAQPDGEQSGEIRIAAIGPGVGVILKDLGLEHLIVGRHGFDMALDPRIPVCGDLNGLDYETLLRVEPTHVFLEWDSREQPTRLEELGATHGWDVRYKRLRSLDDIRACVVEIAALFDVGSAVADRMDSAWSAREPSLASAGRTLLLVQTNPPTALGPGSFHHDVLERIGGLGALGDAGAYVTLDVEDVIRLDPEVIVLVAPREAGSAARENNEADIAALLGPLSGKGISADMGGRVALIDDPLCHTASTALISFADELASVLARWAEDGAGNEAGNETAAGSEEPTSAYTGGDE